MEIQTVIVVLLVLLSAAYLVRKYTRSAKGTGGCGCGCDSSCSAEKRRGCSDQIQR